jgi:hypothetical protein
MSMATYVEGFIPPDDAWRKMRDVRNACVAAGIRVPDDVDRFFNFEAPDPQGQRVPLKDVAKEWRNEHSEGIEIVIADIPKSVKVIRFINSW